MKSKIKDLIIWIYIIVSILFWIVFIAGIESIVESNLFIWFAIIAAVDIGFAKALNIISFYEKNDYL